MYTNTDVVVVEEVVDDDDELFDFRLLPAPPTTEPKLNLKIELN